MELKKDARPVASRPGNQTTTRGRVIVGATERKNKGDVLSLDDVALEIRIGVTVMRARKRREFNSRIRNAEMVFAESGYPQRLALPEVK